MHCSIEQSYFPFIYLFYNDKPRKQVCQPDKGGKEEADASWDLVAGELALKDQLELSVGSGQVNPPCWGKQ